ncbi:sensor histidine kinase [Roseateles sp. NT4]|uniref:sensor histidine kinase n=1 Tax=Roseateles sp. NT4 TaxID=3453715 RepID=UPI003EEFD453
MHPLLAHRRGLAACLLAAALVGTALAALLVVEGLAGLVWALAWALPLSTVLSFVALSLYHLCRSQPFGAGRWPRALTARAAAVLVLGGAALALAAGWNAAGLAFGHHEGLVAMTPAAWGLFLLASLALLTLSVLAHDLLLAMESAQAATSREAEARLLARDMELQLLRLQIDPHFLFNSLNSISALTSFDPDGARQMSIDLAQFFRQTLALGGRERIRLQDEFDLLGHYLAIERQRLGDKLRSAIDAPPEALTALLPPLTLQPLVENALKHGLRALDEGGVVQIQALVRDGWLHLAVRNPVPTEPSREPGLGQGLRHLRERLAAQYRDRARVNWGATPEGFAVEISIPFEKETT